MATITRTFTTEEISALITLLSPLSQNGELNYDKETVKELAKNALDAVVAWEIRNNA
jgi:hypothetical protein